MMFRNWQTRFLIGLLGLTARGGSSDRWSNMVSSSLGRSLSSYKGKFSSQLAYDIDRLVGILPFRNACVVVLALNGNQNFDPTGLVNINAVASKLYQLYRLTETFNVDRLEVVQAHLAGKSGSLM